MQWQQHNEYTNNNTMNTLTTKQWMHWQQNNECTDNKTMNAMTTKQWTGNE